MPISKLKRTSVVRMKFTVKQLKSLGICSEKSWFRYVQAVLLFVIKTFSVITETHTGISLVAMTSNSTATHIPTIHWSFEEKQLIVSSFYFGYVLLILPGGYMVHRFGPKSVLLASCFVNSLVWVLTPFVVGEGRLVLFCILRAIQGITQSVDSSASFGSISTWFPSEEVPLVASIILSGFELGMIISTGVCGLIAQSTLGWPGIYYIFGSFSIAITTLWYFLGMDQPSTISKDDRKVVPWTKILSCVPFISLLVVTCSISLGLVLTTSEMPLYFESMFNVDVRNNVLLCTIPQIASFIMSWILPYIAHILLAIKCISLIQVRKLYNIMYVVITAIVYVRLSFLNKSQKMEAEVLVVIAASSYGFYDIAYTTNIIDLSPNYAAILSSIMDLCTSLVQLIASLVLSQIKVTKVLH